MKYIFKYNINLFYVVNNNQVPFLFIYMYYSKIAKTRKLRASLLLKLDQTFEFNLLTVLWLTVDNLSIMGWCWKIEQLNSDF